MTRQLPSTALLASLLIAVLPGCAKEQSAPPSEAPQTTAPVDKETTQDDEGEPEAVPAPVGATVGDVLPPLPRAAPRLFDGVASASALPDLSCEELVPEKGYKLARRIDVITRGKNKDDPTETLELCLFNKWLQRTDPELGQRTGRKHHLVAAFPGNTVASWTSKEIQRLDLGLPEHGATGLAAGWAGLIATGVPDWPAVAVVSARFYGGELGEEVHYLRRGRVLLHSNGRWTWAPLTERAFATLDSGWLQGRCKALKKASKRKAKKGTGDGSKLEKNAPENEPENELEDSVRGPCAALEVRLARMIRQAEARQVQRERRLAGKDDRLPKSKRRGRRKGKKSKKLPSKPLKYTDDPDPHAAWLRDARKALAGGKWKLAIRNVLRVMVVCGESSKEVEALLKKARGKAGIVAPRIQPPNKRHDLCEPLPDKRPPRDRKR